jgi:hypothetical protein
VGSRNLQDVKGGGRGRERGNECLPPCLGVVCTLKGKGSRVEVSEFPQEMGAQVRLPSYPTVTHERTRIERQ